jgi:hypothetical protein
VYFYVFGGIRGFTLICEENCLGVWAFERFLENWAGDHVEGLRRGDSLCFPMWFGGTLSSCIRAEDLSLVEVGGGFMRKK